MVIASIVGAGLITGLLFSFSNFVMRALAQLQPEKGMFAMQQINEKIINPMFLAIFFGTPLLCAVVAFNSVQELSEPGRVVLFIASVAYVIGPFGITMLFNVPLNNQLARGSLSEAEKVWGKYQIVWQRWNHLRTYIGILSVVLMTVGLSVATH